MIFIHILYWLKSNSLYISALVISFSAKRLPDDLQLIFWKILCAVMKWRVSLRLIANTIPNDKNRSRQENKEWAFSLFPEVTIQSADNALTTSCMWQPHNSHFSLSEWWGCGRVLCPCSILQVLSPSTWLITVSCAPHSFPLKTIPNQLDIPSQQISNLESASKITHQFFREFMLCFRDSKV